MSEIIQLPKILRFKVLLFFFSSLCPSVTIGKDFSSGALFFAIDTTVSYGNSMRVQTSDDNSIGIANGGTADSVNVDDGNLNYNDGSFSSLARFVSEIDIAYNNIGFFSRVNGFYDQQADDTDRTSLSAKARRLVKDNINILDAYVWAGFNFSGIPLNIRLGKHVLSWGESTFIQNGLNVINPFDVSKLRIPGSEIRDALLPVGMVSVSASPTRNLTLEGFYQYDWDRTVLEPTGSFFSTNDFASDGGSQLFLGFGDISDQGDFLAVNRGSDERPGNGGEFGIAMRYFSEVLNDSEFGVYYIHHHNRVPIISSITGSAAGVADAGTLFTSVFSSTLNAAAAGAAATDVYVKTANYFLEYPEDIQRFGLSLNTDIATTGIALQGEYTFIHNAPLQVDDVELLYATLCPLGVLSPASEFNQVDPECARYGSEFRTKIPGFIERNMSQLQLTASKFWGPTLNADTVVMVAEIGMTHVHGMPEKSVLRLESAGTFVSGNKEIASLAHSEKGVEPSNAFADATSWGYRVIGQLRYNNVMGLLNVSPRFAWSHDVAGNSPGPGGNFLQGRKALTFGVEFDYQRVWHADVTYTNFFGAGRYNLLSDRDFTAFTLKYLF